jgi:hypothetical protein
VSAQQLAAAVTARPARQILEVICNAGNRNERRRRIHLGHIWEYE